MMCRENVKPLETEEIKYGSNDLMCNVLPGILFLKITKKCDISSIKRERRTKGKKGISRPKAVMLTLWGRSILFVNIFLHLLSYLHSSPSIV